MKFVKKIVYIIVTCLVCAGCVTKQGEDISRFKDIVYTPRYAKGFEIMADEGGNMLLRVTQPWQGMAPQPQDLHQFHRRRMFANNLEDYRKDLAMSIQLILD